MFEPPSDAAAAYLSCCRRRHNFRVTFSTLQVIADELTPPTDEADYISVASVWVGLDDISGGGSGLVARIGSKDGGRRGSGRRKGWRAAEGGGRFWWIWCNLAWGLAVGSHVAGVIGCARAPHICPIFGLDIRGAGQPGRLMPI